MSIIRNLTAAPIELDDLGGITVPANGDFDLREEGTNDIANSIALSTAITAGDIVFLDGNTGLPLTQQESQTTQDNVSSTQPAITVQSNGVNVAGTPHNVLNFIGTGVSVVEGATTGTVDIDAFAGLSFTTIAGEQILTLMDTTRGTKKLSVEKVNYLYTKSSVSNGTYLYVGYLTSSIVGYVMPMNATIVGIALHVIDGNNTTIQYDLYVNGALHTSNLINGVSSAEIKNVVNTLDIDINQSDKLAMRGLRTSGSSSHTEVSLTLYIRLRG